MNLEILIIPIVSVGIPLLFYFIMTKVRKQKLVKGVDKFIEENSIPERGMQPMSEYMLVIHSELLKLNPKFSEKTHTLSANGFDNVLDVKLNCREKEEAEDLQCLIYIDRVNKKLNS